MSVIIQVPAKLQPITGQTEVEVEGASVAEALRTLVTRYPDLEDRLFSGLNLRPYVRVYLNQEEITYLQGESTPLRDGDCITVVPTVGTSG